MRCQKELLLIANVPSDFMCRQARRIDLIDTELSSFVTCRLVIRCVIIFAARSISIRFLMLIVDGNAQEALAKNNTCASG